MAADINSPSFSLQDITAPLLQVRDLHRHYRPRTLGLGAPGAITRALNGISLSLHAGHSLGIVGESGSGKSTLARLIMALDTPTSGSVWFKGQNLHALPPKALQAARRDFQMVFQDPYASLDPRQRIERIVTEPLHNAVLDAATLRERAAQALIEVGLQASDLDLYPHEFSGGQRQRIAIARAMVLKPRFVMLDEPTSALDMSVQAQVVDLLRDLQKRHDLAYLFISHDLKVVKALANEIIVMRSGRVVEQGPSAEIFAAPKETYTQALMAAAFNLEARAVSAVSQ